MKKPLRQFSYIALLGVSVLGLVLVGFVAKNEASLPFSRFTNELRLFQPADFAKISGAIAQAAPANKDFILASYSECAKESTAINCAAKLEQALALSPADGSIWLEYSKVLVREGDAKLGALDALDRSFNVSSHERWLITARTNFVVSIWNGLTDELKQKAKADVARALPEFDMIDILAKDYIAKPFSHAAIQELVEQATAQQKIRFLTIVSNAAKG